MSDPPIMLEDPSVPAKTKIQGQTVVTFNRPGRKDELLGGHVEIRISVGDASCP